MATRPRSQVSATVGDPIRSLLPWTGIALVAACAADAHSTAHVGVAIGTLQVELEGVASDAAQSTLVEAAFEFMPQSKVGGGIRGRGMASDDDLDANSGDGLPGTMRASEGDWFFHATFDSATGVNRLPFRMGLSARNLDLEDSVSGNAYSFASFGPRIEFAPIVPLITRETLTISASGMVGFGYGFAKIEDSAAGTESEANAGFTDLGLGIRASFGKGFGELGYRYQSSTYEQGDAVLGTTLGEVDATFSGVLLTLGLRF